MSTVNIFLNFQHSREKVNMRLNRNVQSQNRFTIGLFSDMRFANHNSTKHYNYINHGLVWYQHDYYFFITQPYNPIQEFGYLADLWYSYFQY